MCASTDASGLMNVMKWNVAGASVRGAGHAKRGIVCQDAHDWRAETCPDGQKWLFAAVADGAGSAKRSDEGATVAVKAALETVTRDMSHEAFDDSREASDNILEELLTLGIEEARSAVEEFAEKQGAQPADFASTLLLLAAGPSRAAAAQVGDGAIVCAISEGEYTLMTTPQNGEYANQTTFITSDDAYSSIETSFVDETANRFALFTDGIEQIALDSSETEPYAPFFEPLFRFVAQDLGDEALSSQLESFLQSPRIKNRTDDDLTLLLVSGAEKSIPSTADSA